VEAVEMLGAERLVYGRWNHMDSEESMIVRIEESQPVPALGSVLHVVPRADRIHRFDAASGKRL
jgi:sn-glycerol 3-phosphate transport system ATP-binding protein